MPETPQFSEERFMSAEKKRQVLKAWLRFLKGGCKESQFTEALYDHLNQHCSFIAHFNRLGFYEFYFQRITRDVFKFFDQFDNRKEGISAEYGGTHWLSPGNTGSDLSAAMRNAATPFLNKLREDFARKHRSIELSRAARLLQKHGLIPTSTPGNPEINKQGCVVAGEQRSAEKSTQGSLFAEGDLR